MKVILTGATGFLGSHVLKGLDEQNIETIILKRSFSNENRILKYKTKYKSYDVDKISLYEIFKRESKIDAVIHCATNYGRKENNVRDIFQSNVAFPLELLEIAAFFNVDTFINTDSFFGKTKKFIGYMQNYILTKNQFHEWGKLFAESNQINFINMRLEHVYGDEDSDSKFVPLIINSCYNNVEKIDLTDGDNQRDFVYVDDVISAYLTILSYNKQLKGYHEYEVGYGNSVKVKDFVTCVKDVLKSNTELNFGAVPHRENEILYSKADIFKLQELGWYPKFDMQKGIKTYTDKISQNMNDSTTSV